MGQGWIGVNTHRVNAVIAEGATQGRLPGLESLGRVTREVGIQPFTAGERARLDLLLEGEGARAYVEVKNATLLDQDLIRFPDAVSVRALKHVGVLRRLVESGERGVLLFAVNRPEGRAFAPADAIDPAYGRALREAVAQGVEVLAVRLEHDACSVCVGNDVPIEL